MRIMKHTTMCALYLCWSLLVLFLLETLFTQRWLYIPRVHFCLSASSKFISFCSGRGADNRLPGFPDDTVALFAKNSSMDLLAHRDIVCEAYFELVFEDVACNIVILFEDYQVCWNFYWDAKKKGGQNSIYTYFKYPINCRTLFVCFRSERMDVDLLLTWRYSSKLANAVEAANHY
jgi:hypothetical protein